jgi:hypothetical protein
MCTDYIEEVSQPHGQENMVLIRTLNCASPYAVAIALTKSKYFSTKHLVFIYDVDSSCYNPYYNIQANSPVVTWLSKNELEIKTNCAELIQLQEHEVEGVRIIYKIGHVDKK